MSTEPQLAIRRFPDLDPATGELLREFESASSDEVRAVVERARAAQPAWAATPIRKRTALIRVFQQVLLANRQEIAQLISRESGKPVAEAITSEVMVVLDAARFCASIAYEFMQDEPVPHGNLILKTKSGKLVREPHGIIGIISPWNYPFSTPAIEALGAVVTGNAVVIKPSEFTPLVALELVRLLHEAGFPSDLVHAVIGEGPTGAALIDSPIDKLIFTGSVATGKRVAQLAAQRLLPVVLELGGKDPMLVLDDANLDVASSGIIWSACMNAGQTCLSGERCYVDRSLYAAFLDQCRTKISQLRVGRGLDRSTDIGPMIHTRQLQIVEDHVNDAVAQGARLMCGGKRLTELGANFYAPTLLADVTHDMRIMREETFGPVLPVMPFDSDDEAVHLANDSEFGLAASIWSRDSRRAQRIARQLHAGTVMINDAVTGFAISEAPHGGVKSSGIGRTHGEPGLEEMVRLKYVDTDRIPWMKKLWWYPYGNQFTRQMEAFLDFLYSTRLSARIRGALGSAGALRRKRL